MEVSVGVGGGKKRRRSKKKKEGKGVTMVVKPQERGYACGANGT